MEMRSDVRTWTTVFAAGLLLRPVLILAMAPSGPLRGSDLLPVGLLSVFAAHVILGAGVFLGVRPMVALALISAVAGLPLSLLGLVAGLTMPWPVVLAGYNVALVAMGVMAWRDSSRSAVA